MHIPVKPRARLTESEVLSIFKLKASAPSATSVGRLYGVSEKAIRDIWKGRTWSNETWHMEMSRALVVKHAGRPVGCRDNKPRRKRMISEAETTAYKCVDSKEKLGNDPCQEEWSIDFISAAFDQNFPKKSSFASMLMSVDDQLFEWEQGSQHQQTYVDPFKQDWQAIMIALDLSAIKF